MRRARTRARGNDAKGVDAAERVSIASGLASDLCDAGDTICGYGHEDEAQGNEKQSHEKDMAELREKLDAAEELGT